MSEHIAKPRRFWPVDLLRSLAVINMVAYHFMYDWVYLFGLPCSWYSITSCHVWQQYICWSFIFLSGFSTQFSRRIARNGAIVFGCALLLSLVTWFVQPFISFGVLHFLGVALLIVAAARPLLQRLPALPGALVSALLFVVTKELPWKRLGFEGWTLLELPPKLYTLPGLFWLGFKTDTYESGDYFPLIPWLFLFLLGWFVGQMYNSYKSKIPFVYYKDTIAIRIFTWPGRHSLAVYMAHQVVIYLGLLAWVRWGVG